MSFRFAVLSIYILALNGQLAESRVLAVVGPTPPIQFISAAATSGYTVRAAGDLDASAIDALLIVTPLPKEEPKLQERLPGLVKELLRQGKAIFLSLGGSQAGNAPLPPCVSALEPLLPLNLWSVSNSKFTRQDTGAFEGEAESVRIDPTGLHVSKHYDLHLPYAAIEAGEHRYSWQTMDKDLLNTDWEVVLRSDQDGRLPLLIIGRNGPGREYVFGANLFDTELTAWTGYADFIHTLFKRNAAVVSSSNVPLHSIEIRVARYQNGPLKAQLINTATSGVTGVFTYKVGNAEHQLLNSATQAIKIPARGTISVTMNERSRYLGDPAIVASGDSAYTYRFVRAGFADSSRSNLFAETSTIVDRTPPITIAVQGEDIKSFDDSDQYPDRFENNQIGWDAPIGAYVYAAGTIPKLSVEVRNGLHNIAPLATPKDFNWPDNPTVQGLNDLAVSTDSLRGKLPVFGFWSGQAAAEHEIGYTWHAPVTIAGQEIYGQIPYRHHDKNNPASFTLFGIASGVTKTLVNQIDARYANALHRDIFEPATLDTCRLRVVGLDPRGNYEPYTTLFGQNKSIQSNSGILEWSILGWPSAKLPPKVTGRLIATLTDVITGSVQTILDQALSLAPLQESNLALLLPSLTRFGTYRVDVSYSVPGQPDSHSKYDLLVVDPGHKSIVSNPHTDMSLLCEPGFAAFDDFGLGTSQDTQGWVGPDNAVWALTHDLMEIGSSNRDIPARLFTTCAKFTHYSCPWRDFPSGQYVWDWGTDNLEQMVQSGKLKLQPQKTLHIFLSDRWNGIPVSATFTWADFVEFDVYLRKTTGHGLSGRSREQIDKEITTRYGDVWQEWQMNRYADRLLAIQGRFAERGIDFTVTTHGSFPLVGGELGAKIARTHIASGTDVFWELRNEDLYQSLGYRFGLIAANPDYESGAYNEWGWTSSALNSPHWFGDTGANEPSRRQWYGTYFEGRVTTAGAFEPLTKFGFYGQASPGPKMTDDDFNAYYRVQRLVTRIRPEKPAGFGLVVSWNEQLRHLGSQAGSLGTGIYAAKGFGQIDQIAGEAYQHLIKNGVPISFLASTDSLKKWQGTNPLIVVDGATFNKAEIADLERLNRAGAPIVSIGSGIEATNDGAEFFGLTLRDGSFSPPSGTVSLTDNSETIIYLTKRNGRAPVLLCPIDASKLSARESAALSKKLLESLGSPLRLSPGVTATPFINHNSLFIELGDQGDMARIVEVEVRPSLLNPAMDSRSFRVVDVDRNVVLPAQMNGNLLTFSIPVSASDGRLIMLEPRQ